MAVVTLFQPRPSTPGTTPGSNVQPKAKSPAAGNPPSAEQAKIQTPSGNKNTPQRATPKNKATPGR